jgi:hypothetical protein
MLYSPQILNAYGKILKCTDGAILRIFFKQRLGGGRGFQFDSVKNAVNIEHGPSIVSIPEDGNSSFFSVLTMHFLTLSKRPTIASLIQCIGA